jgi:type II secretory pathway component GspD/PulD (secretin)
MKIKPEISSVSSTLTTPTNNKIPIIDTSLAETTVMVKDGTSVIISGLRREEVVKSYEQLPILGSIPFLNYAFRSGNEKTERTELLILLTPHIISGVQLTSGDEKVFTGGATAEYHQDEPFASEKTKMTTMAIQPKTYREFSENEALGDVKEPKYVH